MKNAKVLDWNLFFKGEVVKKDNKVNKTIPSIATGIWVVGKTCLVSAASASTGDATGLERLIFEILNIADYVAWGGLIFAGASWMFNNKTVAIERGIGVTAGYLIIRKSWDYIQFLKGV